jgi:glycosyltransferase involved in cell wall biosynthesis
MPISLSVGAHVRPPPTLQWPVRWACPRVACGVDLYYLAEALWPKVLRTGTDVLFSPNDRKRTNTNLTEPEQTAMRLGIPVVTTPIGVEGLGIEPGIHAMVAEDASGVARNVLELLHDPERCAALSKAGADLVRHQFSLGAARTR